MIRLLVLHLAVLSLFFFSAESSFAVNLNQQVKDQLQAGAQSADFGAPVAPQATVAGVITFLLSIMGMTFIVLIIMGGYMRLTSHGEEDRIEKGTKTITAAVVGLAIVLSAYAITKFVAVRVQNAAAPTQVYQEDQLDVWEEIGGINLQ